MLQLSLTLHSPSILIAGGTVGFFGCMFLARSRAVRRLPYNAPIRGIWLSAAVLLTVACFGNAFRGLLDTWVVFGPLNALTIAPFGLLWLSARRLLGRRDTAWWAALPPGIWLAAAALPGVTESFSLRVLLIVPLCSALVAGAAVELHVLHRREGVRSAFDLGVMLALVVAWLWVLLVATLVSPPDRVGNWGFVGPPTALLIALVTGTLPLLMLALARELAMSREAAIRLEAVEEGRAQITRLHDGLQAIIFLRTVAPDGSSRLLYRGGDVAGVTGLPLADMEADGLPVQVPHGSVAPISEHFAEVLRHGAGTLVWHFPQPDGGSRILRTASRLLRLLPGGAAEVVGYTTDVTAECAAEARAVTAARLAAVGEMGKGLAHEIKQPLQAISLAAELVALGVRNGQTEMALGRIDIIVDQAARAAEVVEHLRRFSTDGGDAARTLPVDLGDVVKAALGLTWHALDEAGVQVELSLGRPAPLVLANDVGLSQVLVHLIINARDAMCERPLGAPRRLLIGASTAEQGHVALTVADTGGGIDAAILPQLFVPFVTTKAPDRGRGVGLAASRGLVGAMGGTIIARNEAEGALFVITLTSASLNARNSTKDCATQADATPTMRTL